jgi:hypothetical protein
MSDKQDEEANSIDLHSRAKVVEYELMHNISRPMSPINLVVRTTTPIDLKKDCGKPVEDQTDLSDSSPISPSAQLSVQGKRRRGKHLSEASPFRNKNGVPLITNPLASLPDTIKIRGKTQEPIIDDELIFVQKYNIPPKEELKRNRTIKITPIPFFQVILKITSFFFSRLS